MWLPSKLKRPARLRNAIKRPRVLQSLQQASLHKLVLFRSPAGYGKTTMAAQWLSDTPSVGWYNLDQNDNDVFHFVNYFIQALNKATNGNCPNSQTIVERQQYSSLKALFSEVFSELACYEEECYLVLDDYHLIEEDEIHEAMRFFLKYMPDNITLVVTSRSTPPLGVANLRVRNSMIEIGSDLLAFDTKETSSFFNEYVSEEVDDAVADKLRQYVEGWPSALQLIALQSQHQNVALARSADFVSHFSHSHLWEYLVEEVFNQLDFETQHFLMQCSVLSSFNDTLVNALTGRDDALSMLEQLNRYGLFISSLEGEQNWFRFHHLFAEFLAHERRKRIPKEENQLHRSAAKAWLQLGIPHRAIIHAQNANDSELLAQLVTAHGWQMFDHGEVNALEQAISRISEDKLYASIKLPLLRAWIAQSQYRFADVEEILTKAEHEVTQRNVVLSSNEKGQINALLAQVAINTNAPEKAQALAEQAITQLDSTAYRGRIVATSIVAEVNHVMGQLDKALALMQQTESLSRRHSLLYQTTWAILQQSEILMAQGLVQAAFDMQERAFQLIAKEKRQQLPPHELLLRNRAQILWSWNRLDEAQECAHKALNVLGESEPGEHLHCYSMLARVAISRGEVDKATRFIGEITQLLQQSTYHVDWIANASFSLLLYWQATGDSGSVEHWLETVSRPENASNHFLQLQYRNIARAQILLKKYDDAAETLTFLQSEAEKTNRVTDTNCNLIIESVLAAKAGEKSVASEKLQQALALANQTGMMGDFLVDGATLEPILRELIADKLLPNLERHRAQLLISELASRKKSTLIHFDEEFICELVNSPNLPEVVRMSPLTLREWQVLGLIYSGLTNDQIAKELAISATTIKTHIRNSYQKLSIGNRTEAIATVENILKLTGNSGV
ncbi:HTH-type transcriptional regulator MalT [Vibrio sp. JC009]|uniref:HTH-type transcriptional regulator MalT n=1 Tax=Vibrio sp. JC009 TaxID=2912314 RepID=UPI0023B0D7D8|nr:HTH-type transcriptional regulator MalT [Vibrio sp. JC009]WED23989.1 HTH-type transcriptional regulator MalT [Vibrio sp. JC009]